MTELEKNQIIHEAMGKCWHEVAKQQYTSQRDEYTGQCIKCKKEQYWNDGESINPSYTSDWMAYGEFLEWAQGKEWWKDFAYTHYDADDGITWDELNTDLLNPLRGSTAFAEFWERKYEPN